MISLFRSGNPITIFFLIIYALVVKFFFFLHPPGLLLHHTDGYLFTGLVHYLTWLFGGNPLYFTLLAVGLLFMQAMQLNRLVGYFRLLPGNSFLPAMSYLLLTSFFKQWNGFSAALLTNSFLLIAMVGIMRLYNRSNVKGMVFNIGFIIGLAVLFYFPAVLFLALLWLSLIIIRPFRMAEWVVSVLGILCPFYFYSVYLFMTNRFTLLHKVVFWGWAYPNWQHINWVLASVIIMIGFFIYGAIQLQRQFFTMLIHVRKIWLVLLSYACVAVIIAFLNQNFSINTWLLAVVPVSAYMANAWWSMKKNWLASLVHLALIGFVFCHAILG